jgi:hypothetical protein
VWRSSSRSLVFRNYFFTMRGDVEQKTKKRALERRSGNSLLLRLIMTYLIVRHINALLFLHFFAINPSVFSAFAATHRRLYFTFLPWVYVICKKKSRRQGRQGLCCVTVKFEVVGVSQLFFYHARWRRTKNKEACAEAQVWEQFIITVNYNVPTRDT